MRWDELSELHYITPINNVESIETYGILSFHRAKRIPHISVAMQDIQDIRSGRAVPGGMPLHRYANLYFHARNPMLYKRRGEHLNICVLRINKEVLRLPDVVITDANAASEYTSFQRSPEGLERIDRNMVFANNWTDPDPIKYWRKKSAKCAEALVPERIEPDYIIGAFVSCRAANNKLIALDYQKQVTIDPHFFFM